MNSDLARLADRIRESLTEVNFVLSRIAEGWQRAHTSGDEYYLDGVALNLHSFYSGIERIFELIVEVVDGGKPSGENWHQALLMQVANELPGVRPAVISSNTFQGLSAYRGFRHIVRNVYAFRFDSEKIGRLVEQAPHIFNDVSSELLAFADFLDENS